MFGRAISWNFNTTGLTQQESLSFFIRDKTGSQRHMRYRSKYFVIIVVRERADDFVFARWYLLEVAFGKRQVAHLKLLLLVRTVTDAFRYSRLEELHAVVKKVFVVKRFDEFAVVKLGKIADLEVLREHFVVHFEMNLEEETFPIS